jgi:hypothetical protein
VENKGKLILTEIFPSVQKYDIYNILKADQNPRKQLGDRGMKAVRPVIDSNGISCLQTMSLGSSGMEKEGDQERTREAKRKIASCWEDSRNINTDSSKRFHSEISRATATYLHKCSWRSPSLPPQQAYPANSSN